MSKVNFPRLATSVAAGLVVCLIVGLQTSSMLATKRAPDAAISLFAGNGAAYEEAAFDAFAKQAAANPKDLSGAASSVRELAVEAVRRDPTTAKALALLALAMPDLEQRHAAALAAAQINRRDLTLQGMALEAHLANDETTGVIETLDQILRVHPDYAREFHPVLGQALVDESTVPAFVRFLDGSSPWHESFFTTYALGQPNLLPNLAVIRMQRPIGDEGFDRRLVLDLAKNGELESAQALFDFLSQGEGVEGGDASAPGMIAWSADFPPFDWKFTDEGGFRAQASRDGSALEMFVRPGKGGIIAERIVAMPDGPFELRFSFSEATRTQAEAVRIELSCAGQQLPFFAQKLSAGDNALKISDVPSCDQMRLVINARAFTGQKTLRSRMSRITLKTR